MSLKINCDTYDKIDFENWRRVFLFFFLWKMKGADIVWSKKQKFFFFVFLKQILHVISFGSALCRSILLIAKQWIVLCLWISFSIWCFIGFFIRKFLCKQNVFLMKKYWWKKKNLQTNFYFWILKIKGISLFFKIINYI